MQNDMALRVINLTIVGSGEPLLRLQKRLTCAATTLKLKLNLEIRKDHDVYAIPFEQTPAVFVDGKMAFSRLPRTEEIEDWLKLLAKSSSDTQ